jgi:hypothetical protein
MPRLRTYIYSILHHESHIRWQPQIRNAAAAQLAKKNVRCLQNTGSVRRCESKHTSMRLFFSACLWLFFSPPQPSAVQGLDDERAWPPDLTPPPPPLPFEAVVDHAPPALDAAAGLGLAAGSLRPSACWQAGASRSQHLVDDDESFHPELASSVCVSFHPELASSTCHASLSLLATCLALPAASMSISVPIYICMYIYIYLSSISLSLCLCLSSSVRYRYRYRYRYIIYMPRLPVPPRNMPTPPRSIYVYICTYLYLYLYLYLSLLHHFVTDTQKGLG